MTDQSPLGGSQRNLALVGYGLLIAAVFFAGAPALVAVVIAYSQRPEAPPAIRRHYDLQIRIFWVGFALALAAGLCLMGALVSSVGDVVAYTQTAGLPSTRDFDIDMSRLRLDGRVVALLVGFVALTLVSLAWMVCASAIGFIRLASLNEMGDSPAA